MTVKKLFIKTALILSIAIPAQEVDSRAVLVVRSLISAETTSDGYLESFDDSKLFERGLRDDEGLEENPVVAPTPSLTP